MERVSISLIACYINIVYAISESGLIIHGINWYNINLNFVIISKLQTYNPINLIGYVYNHWLLLQL